MCNTNNETLINTLFIHAILKLYYLQIKQLKHNSCKLHQIRLTVLALLFLLGTALLLPTAIDVDVEMKSSSVLTGDINFGPVRTHGVVRRNGAKTIFNLINCPHTCYIDGCIDVDLRRKIRSSVHKIKQLSNLSSNAVPRAFRSKYSALSSL